MIRKARELSALLDEVGDINWSHPAWWAVVGGTLLLERVGRTLPDDELYAEYLAANGGPDADTFMAREATGAAGPAERIARAVARARAALSALARLEGQLPGQRLGCALRWERGWLRRQELPAAPSVAVVAEDRVLLLDVTDAEEAARALARALAGETTPGCLLVDRRSNAPTPTAVAVALGDFPLARVRHLHRLAWTRGGGPWLGVGDAPPHAAVSTCHLAVDGYGHALLADAILGAPLGPPPASLPLPGADLSRPPADPAALPVSFAGAVVPGNPRFSAIAWAFGRALRRLHPPRDGARFGPAFQFALAPGERDDPERRARRLLHGLLSVRTGESFDAFRTRVPAIVAREAAAGGVLTRVLRAVTGVPLPDAVRRRLLATRHGTRPRLPPGRVLGGLGDLSVLRFAAGEAPAPALYAASTAPGVVLCLVHHDGCLTATACTPASFTDDATLARLLEDWRTDLRRATAASRPSPEAPGS